MVKNKFLLREDLFGHLCKVLNDFETSNIGRNIGHLWIPKILKGKKITTVFNKKKALTKYSFLIFQSNLLVKTHINTYPLRLKIVNEWGT